MFIYCFFVIKFQDRGLAIRIKILLVTALVQSIVFGGHLTSHWIKRKAFSFWIFKWPVLSDNLLCVKWVPFAKAAYEVRKNPAIIERCVSRNKLVVHAAFVLRIYHKLTREGCFINVLYFIKNLMGLRHHPAANVLRGNLATKN